MKLTNEQLRELAKEDIERKTRELELAKSLLNPNDSSMLSDEALAIVPRALRYMSNSRRAMNFVDYIGKEVAKVRKQTKKRVEETRKVFGNNKRDRTLNFSGIKKMIQKSKPVPQSNNIASSSNQSPSILEHQHIVRLQLATNQVVSDLE